MNVVCVYVDVSLFLFLSFSLSLDSFFFQWFICKERKKESNQNKYSMTGGFSSKKTEHLN